MDRTQTTAFILALAGLVLAGLSWGAGSARAQSRWFEDVTATHLPQAPELHSLDVSFADVDGDGDLDAVIAAEIPVPVDVREGGIERVELGGLRQVSGRDVLEPVRLGAGRADPPAQSGENESSESEDKGDGLRLVHDFGSVEMKKARWSRCSNYRRIQRFLSGISPRAIACWRLSTSEGGFAAADHRRDAANARENGGMGAWGHRVLCLCRTSKQAAVAKMRLPWHKPRTRAPPAGPEHEVGLRCR